MSNIIYPYHLTLLITERCNLRCAYCYCDKGRTTTMTIPIAHQAIDDVMTAQTDRPLRLLLMGGEPFLEFELIKDIVEYVRMKCRGRDIFVKTVTNGTLVHGEVQQWLIDNRDLFHASLSLDGTREIHNRNRCGSYDSIDIDFFVRLYGQNAEASMVACPDNLDYVAENVIALQEKGFRTKCVLADDCLWDAQRDPSRWATQLSTLVEYYLSHPNQMPVSQLLEAINFIGDGTHPEKCQPNFNTHCVYTDGTHYGCHRCSPYYNNNEWLVETDLSKPKMLHEGCAACPAQPVCCSCPSMVESARKHPEVASALCALFRVTHLANATLIARMFLECPDHIRLRKLDNTTKRNLIAGAQSIINNLKP